MKYFLVVAALSALFVAVLVIFDLEISTQRPSATDSQQSSYSSNDEEDLGEGQLSRLSRLDNDANSAPSSALNDNVIRQYGGNDPESVAIVSKLAEAEYRQAVAMLNNAYSLMSREQIEALKSLFMQTADKLMQDGKPAAAVELLTHYSASFDELQSWRLLGRGAAKTGNWPLALQAQTRALQQENTNEGFNETLARLNLAASSVRAGYERNDDFSAIVAMYEKLNTHFPDQTKFQLDLAQAYLRIGDTASATTLLTALRFDPEFGNIANQVLSKLEANKPGDTLSDNLTPPTNQLRVPLQRMGSSLIAPIQIGGQSLRLLLDTGASITAFSPATVRQLGLEPTGQTISLSTANGVRQSSLYLAPEIRLGALAYSNVIIAEVELDPGSQIQGLLGTDLLRRTNDRYSYVIDDQKNALIFRPL